TAVAESSLTVPGVRTVVDSGLAREPRTDHARGLGALTTVRASRATAGQRAGRAGREAPGAVYRCWSEAEHDRLPARPRPELALAGLTGFALQAACWGDPDASGLALLDPPPPAALEAARDTLRALGAVRPLRAASGPGEVRVTDRGRALARIGLHPRLARALVDGAPEVGVRDAAQVVALLAEPPPRSAGDDLTAAWRALRRQSRPADAHAARWRDETRRLQRALDHRALDHREAPAGRAPSGEWKARGDDATAGVVAALAFPERVARRRGSGYLMASGTGAVLAADSALAAARPEWLAIAAADRPAGSASARVRQAVVIDEEVARVAAARPDPDPERVRAALLDGLRADGLGLLNWTRNAVALRERLAFLREALGDPWPDVGDAALLERVPDWLGSARRRADLKHVDVAAMLRGTLTWEQAKRLDEYAPERVESRPVRGSGWTTRRAGPSSR